MGFRQDSAVLAMLPPLQAGRFVILVCITLALMACDAEERINDYFKQMD